MNFNSSLIANTYTELNVMHDNTLNSLNYLPSYFPAYQENISHYDGQEFGSIGTSYYYSSSNYSDYYSSGSQNF